MTEIGLAEYFGIIVNSRLAINKIFLIIFIYLINSTSRKIAPVTPNATTKPFQKSVKKSLFIY
jgi:hypothetical protein